MQVNVAASIASTVILGAKGNADQLDTSFRRKTQLRSCQFIYSIPMKAVWKVQNGLRRILTESRTQTAGFRTFSHSQSQESSLQCSHDSSAQICQQAAQ